MEEVLKFLNSINNNNHHDISLYNINSKSKKARVSDNNNIHNNKINNINNNNKSNNIGNNSISLNNISNNNNIRKRKQWITSLQFNNRRNYI